MTAAVVAFAVALHAALAWRFSRVGGAAVARASAVRAAATALGIGAGLVAWNTGAGAAVAAGIGVVASAAVDASVTRTRRAAARSRDREGGDPATPPRVRWARRVDRAAGAAMGLVAASVLCAALAVLGGMWAFSDAVARGAAGPLDDDAASLVEPRAEPVDDRRSRWAGLVGEASSTLANVSGMRVLTLIPQAGEAHREVRACVALLNASPEQMRRLVAMHDLLRFADDPAIDAALNDSSYTALIAAARGGDLVAVAKLVDHERTHAVLSSPGVRAFAERVTPSRLVADMRAAAIDRPGSLGPTEIATGGLTSRVGVAGAKP